MMGLIDRIRGRGKGDAVSRIDRKLSGLHEEDVRAVRRFSYWTRWHKLALASLAAVVLGSGSVGAYHCGSDVLRRSEYEMRVRDHTSQFRSAPQHTIPPTHCLRPGSEAHVFRSAMIDRDDPYNARTMILTDRLRNRMEELGGDGPMLCIRPVDGGQDVAVESMIQVRGLDYDAVRSGQDAGLRMMHGVPGIFSPDSEVSSVSVNGRDIPLSYLAFRDPDHVRREGHYYLDIGALVEDRLIWEDDFDDLYVGMSWSVGFDRISPLDNALVAPVSAVQGLPKHVRRYIQPTQEFPSQHQSIADVVEAYDGDRDDIMAVVRYAVDAADEALEYYRPGHHDRSVPDLFRLEKGNCLDYARMYVTLMRAFGIPARIADANVLQTGGGSSIDGYHAWAEVYVPMLDGNDRWVNVEPTWADNGSAVRYINFVTNRYLYDLNVRAELYTGRSDGRHEMFQTHDLVSVPREYASPEAGGDDGVSSDADDDCFGCVTYMHGDDGGAGERDGGPGMEDGGGADGG